MNEVIVDSLCFLCPAYFLSGLSPISFRTFFPVMTKAIFFAHFHALISTPCHLATFSLLNEYINLFLSS